MRVALMVTCVNDAMFPEAKGKSGQFFRTFYNYGKYDLESYDHVDGWTYIGTWVRRTSWAKGADVSYGVSVPATKAANCAPYVGGSSHETTTSRAITWSDGAELSAAMKGVLGTVSLSTRTGFTEQATNVVNFRRDARLCGVYGDLSRPGMLVARPKLAG